jgi:hypothetical protein
VEEKMDAAPAAVEEKMDAAPAAVVVPTVVVPTEAAPAAVEEPMEAAPAAVEEKTQPEDAGDADEDPSSEMEEEEVPEPGSRKAVLLEAATRIATLEAQGPVLPHVRQDIIAAAVASVCEKEEAEYEAAMCAEEGNEADKSDGDCEDLYAAAGGEMTLADFP